jgi:hypothetical protein
MYSVLVNKRPIKFAFLVNPAGPAWQEQLDAIWTYNLDKWGGRFNTIIPTNGNEIDPEWWQFLKRIDPDYVYSATALSDELLERIKADVCPIDIELPRPNQSSTDRPQIFTYNDTIQVVPTSRNISRLSRTPFLDSQLIILRPGYNADEEVKRFIIRNFGEYPDIIFWNKVLEGVRHQVFQVNTKAELVEALKQISLPPANYVYPIQFSAIESPKFYLDYQLEHSYDVFGLIIGDTFEDQLFAWHKVFFSTYNQWHRLNHVWLPTAFANDLEVMEALGEWLRRMTEHVHLFSLSIPESKLNEVGERLDITKESRRLMRQELYKTATAYSSFPFPKFSEGLQSSFWNRFSNQLRPPKEADYYRAYSLNEEFEIKSPAPADGLRDKGYWMTEVFIEADRNRFYNEKVYLRQNSSFWWQLPRKNYLATDIFREKARINAQGIPTIQLPAKTPQLKFQLPDERELLRHCVLGDVHGKMFDQVKRKGSDITEVEFSNIGKYLSGFLEVFGGLAFAHDVLADRFWRNMFGILSGQDLAEDPTAISKVRDKLRKRVEGNKTASEIRENLEDLADYVIELSKEVSLEGEKIEFKRFLEEAQREHDEFRQYPWLLHHADLKDSVSLFGKMKERRDPVSKYLYAKLTPDTRRMIDSYDPSHPPYEALITSFLIDTNKLLTGESLYDRDAFAKVQLSEYVQSLIAQQLEGPYVIILNRMLLEEAYPSEIVKEQSNADRINWDFDENSIRRPLSRMLELGIIQMGFSQKCPRCGSINWYLIDEAGQKVICDGCRYEFSMPVEPKISYRLNSLVRRGIFAHGLVPVVLVLGQLLKDARSSFFYSPTLAFRTAEGKKGDLDIVCIKDGQFVIGEVKKRKRFNLMQSSTLAKVAEAMEADILLFSSLEEVQRNDSKEIINKVREKLEGSNLQAGWYQLGSEVFEPSRMDY